MSTNQGELHNELAGKIVKSIVKPIVEADGSEVEILVLLESVVTGVILYVTRTWVGDEIVLDKLIVGVKERLAEIRLGNMEMQDGIH